MSLVACASAPPDGRARQVAVEKAYKIVARRGWKLPANHRVRVDKFQFIPEDGRAPYDEWLVTFDQPQPHRSPAPLYRAEFLCSTGEFVGAYDERGEIRDDEVAVAKRAFELRFPGEDYTTFAGAEDGIVKVHFLADKVPYRPGHFPPHREVDVVVDRATLRVKSLKEVRE